MKDEYPEMGLATVYRTLQLLYEIQLIDRIHFNDGCIRYEIGHIFDGDSKHSHHHLICRTCGRVMPFEDDFWRIWRHRSKPIPVFMCWIMN